METPQRFANQSPWTEKGRIGAAMRYVRSEADGACCDAHFYFHCRYAAVNRPRLQIARGDRPQTQYRAGTNIQFLAKSMRGHISRSTRPSSCDKKSWESQDRCSRVWLRRDRPAVTGCNGSRERPERGYRFPHRRQECKNIRRPSSKAPQTLPLG